jgi:YVTN family beta-propeller protein
MKKIKYLVLILTLSFFSFTTILLIYRNPNFSIKTNGTLLIVNKLSKSITVFDLNKGEEITELFLEIEPHEAIALNNQEQFVITNYGDSNYIGKSISVLNTNTYKVEKIIDLDVSHRPHGIAKINGSNNVAIVTDIGNDLLIVDIESGSIKTKISTQQKLSHMVVVHPTKPLAYVTNVISGSISIIDLKDEKVICIIECGGGTEGVDITPDGKELWVTNSQDNSISIISTITNKVIDTLATGNEALRLKFSIDGKYCLVPNSKDGTIRIYDQKTRKQIKIISVPGKTNLIERVLYHTPRPVGILVHPNGKYVFVANSNADKVEVIDMRTFEIVSTIGTGRVPDGLAFLN